MKSYFLFLVFTIIGHTSFSSELKSIDQLVNFDYENENTIAEMDLILLGIVTNPNPEAIFNFEEKNIILSIGEKINDLTLIDIGNAKITFQLPNKELVDMYLGEGLVKLNLNQTIIGNQIIGSVESFSEKNDLPEFIRANKAVDQFIEKGNISSFETKVLQALTYQPGLSNAGRVGWLMPDNILGHAIEKLHFKPGDLILNVNGIPAERVPKLYEMYKDNSIKNFSIEVKRGDTLLILEIIRP